MDRKTDINQVQPMPGDGKDVTDTKMLTGLGDLSAAQLATNVTKPYNTGKAPDTSPHGGRARRS